MKKPGRRAALRGAMAAAGLAAVAGGVLPSLIRQDRFPHERHAGLFPTCVGCHGGIAAGDTAAFVSVTPEDCASCHDGVELERVAWTGPEPRASNLAFPHPPHVDLEIECVDCHNVPGAENRMAVQRAKADSCLECHAPDAEGHFDLAAIECSTCHLTLAQATRLPQDRIANFPRPAEHDRPDFLLVHGSAAEAGAGDCAVCHARESCERCHLNADRLAPITELEEDPRIAMLVAGRPGEWPEPPSHDRPDWGWVHGESAREEIEECATCHARPSCAACHVAGSVRLVDELPEPRPGGPQGVLLADVRPAGHTADFALNHATAAAVDMPDCAACHTERQCADCHDAAGKPEFHPVDFVLRHGPEAFGNETECAACHSGEAFCRDCHMASGFAAGGRTGGAFHDAVPDWLLAHGRAARQNLEACTTCHVQSTCLRCHSAKSGFRISPHGPDFDPEAVADRSQQACGICHFSLPVAP